MLLVWVIAFAALVVIETMTMELTFLSIALGCLAGALVAWLGLGVPAQVVAATVGSLAALFLMAPMLRRRLHVRDTATATDAIVGSEAEVVEAIVPPGAGKVKLDGVVWNAISNREIPQGAHVLVTELSGTRLTVVSRADVLSFRQAQPSAPAEELPRPQSQQDLL